MAGGRDWSDLGPRIGSAVVLAAIGFSLIWSGPIGTAILASVGCGVMGWEAQRIVSGGEISKGVATAAVISAAVPPLLVILVGPAVAAAVAVGMVLAIGFLARNRSISRRDAIIGGLVISLAGVGFVWLRGELTYGLHTLIWLPLVVIAADVGGYFAGRMIGGPKLAPKLSPNKTVSGAIGGQALAVVVGVLFVLVTNIGSVLIVGTFSLVVAIVSQIGDLFESAAKRRYGVKDASTILPGHGGVLDRFDGLMAALLFDSAVTAVAGSTVFAW